MSCGSSSRFNLGDFLLGRSVRLVDYLFVDEWMLCVRVNRARRDWLGCQSQGITLPLTAHHRCLKSLSVKTYLRLNFILELVEGMIEVCGIGLFTLLQNFNRGASEYPVFVSFGFPGALIGIRRADYNLTFTGKSTNVKISGSE